MKFLSQSKIRKNKLPALASHSYEPGNYTFAFIVYYLLLSCYSCNSCCLVKATAGDSLFLIDLKIPLFYLLCLFSKSQCSYQNLQFNDVKVLFIYFNISMMFNKIWIQLFSFDVTTRSQNFVFCQLMLI